MRQRFFFAIIIALSLGTSSVKANAQTTCFMCDDYEDVDGYWKHYDVRLFFNELHGAFHPSPVYNSCQHEGHYYYCNGCGGFAAAALERAARKGQDGQLLSLLAADGATLNVARSALQILGPGDRILLHLPLSRAQTGRIKLALNELRERQVVGQKGDGSAFLGTSTPNISGRTFPPSHDPAGQRE